MRLTVPPIVRKTVVRKKLLTTTLLIPCCLSAPLLWGEAFATTITGPYVGMGLGIDVASAQHYHIASEQQPDNGHPTAEEPPTGGHTSSSSNTPAPNQHTNSENNGGNGDQNNTGTNGNHSSTSGGGNNGGNSGGGNNGGNSDHDNNQTPTKTTGESPTGDGTQNSGNKGDNGNQDNPTPAKKTVSNNGEKGNGESGTGDKGEGNKGDNHQGSGGSGNSTSPQKTPAKNSDNGDGDPYTDGQKQPGYPYHGQPYHYPTTWLKSLRRIRCSIYGAGRSRSGQIAGSNQEGQIIIDPDNGQPLCMMPQEIGPYVDGQLGNWRYAEEPGGKIPSSWHFGETWPGVNPYTLPPGIVPSVLLGYFSPIENVFSQFAKIAKNNAAGNLAQSFDVGSNVGFAGLAAFGWGFGNGMRAEIEGFAGGIGGNRRTRPSYGGFINVLYDIDLQRLFGLRSIVTPFVGIGGGYLGQHYSNIVTANNTATLFGTNSGFAWQGMAGVGIDTGVRGLQATAQYSIIGQPQSLSYGLHYIDDDGDHGIAKANRLNNLFLVGLRYRFHVSPENHPPINTVLAAAAAPAPVAARSYLVFFDWNKYALTPHAKQIIAEAAQASTHVQTTRIKVNGYTDNSAAPGAVGKRYNLALSVKRAKSVEAELIRNGVPLSEIVIRGYGDANPLVPTAPNTRKPQNRRVEIILHA